MVGRRVKATAQLPEKMTDGERTDLGLTKATGKRLIYKTAND